MYCICTYLCLIYIFNICIMRKCIIWIRFIKAIFDPGLAYIPTVSIPDSVYKHAATIIPTPLDGLFFCVCQCANGVIILLPIHPVKLSAGFHDCKQLLFEWHIELHVYDRFPPIREVFDKRRGYEGRRDGIR